ncbi:MAG: pyruvate kinase [Acidimicrobiia bacterium]
MQRRTKIVATVGPASEDPATLRKMVVAGMNMARLSLAHGPVEETLERIQRVRRAAEEEGELVGILADLPGPKVRSASFPEGGVYLIEGEAADIVPAEADVTSDSGRIAVDLPDLLTQLRVGDTVALGDGGIKLFVEVVDGARAVARVVTGGRVQGRPGVVLPAGRSTMSTPTAEDLRLLEVVCEAGVDAVAVSFVRSAVEVERVRAHAGRDAPMLVAKIETQEAVDALDEVISAADGVMVARGDLGIRCALEDVPHYQKRIIRAGLAYGRPVITATQMLESMIHSPAPTRAEVSDVANAVFDGTSALMLSGETAIGHDPVAAVLTMAKVAARAERDFNHEGWGALTGRQQISATRGAPASVRVTAAISAASLRAATDADATAIIACTNGGASARSIARFCPTVGIIGATPSPRTARQLSVAWGVTPVVIPRQTTTDGIVKSAIAAATDLGLIAVGDVVAVLVGAPDDPEPWSNVLRLERIR